MKVIQCSDVNANDNHLRNDILLITRGWQDPSVLRKMLIRMVDWSFYLGRSVRDKPFKTCEYDMNL